MFLFSFIHKSHVLSSFASIWMHIFVLCDSTHALKFSFPLLPVLLMSTTVLYLGYPHFCFGWVIRADFCFCFVFYFLCCVIAFLLRFIEFICFSLLSAQFYAFSNNSLFALFALSYNSYRKWWILVFYVFIKNNFREEFRSERVINLCFSLFNATSYVFCLSLTQ